MPETAGFTGQPVALHCIKELRSEVTSCSFSQIDFAKKCQLKKKCKYMCNGERSLLQAAGRSRIGEARERTAHRELPRGDPRALHLALGWAGAVKYRLASDRINRILIRSEFFQNASEFRPNADRIQFTATRPKSVSMPRTS